MKQTLDMSFFFYARIQALEPQHDKFLNASDDSIGVWCVPSATYIACTDQSQSTVLGTGMFVTTGVVTLRTLDTKPWSGDSSGKESRTVSFPAFFMCLSRRFCLQHSVRKRIEGYEF
jgi:hypothetical protein